MKTMPKYLIFSGEGERGTWEPYTGAELPKAIKTRLTKERAGGDRWASIWRKTDMVDHYTGWPVYECFDPETGEVADIRSIEPDETLTLSNAAATLGRKGGMSKSDAKVSASRENGKKGGRPSMKKIKEALNIRTEKQGYVNGTLHYKVWRFRADQNAYVFDGSYTYQELKEEAQRG